MKSWRSHGQIYWRRTGKELTDEISDYKPARD
jgi:hypothetical protein